MLKTLPPGCWVSQCPKVDSGNKTTHLTVALNSMVVGQIMNQDQIPPMNTFH